MDAALNRFQKDITLLKIYATILTLALLGLAAWHIADSRGKGAAGNILRARGLVIVDENGRDRILIGAPVPGSPQRIRTDFEKAKGAWGKRFPHFDWYKKLDHRTNGILILDEKGFDRIAIGDPTPDPNIGRRISPACGIQINDREGFERTGWGYFAGLGRVVLGLDSAKGTEAVVLVVREDDTAGLSVSSGENAIFLGSLPPQNDIPDLDKAFHGLLVRDRKVVHHKLGIPGN
ncbi:MAG: hypothetical protein AB1715_08310 [Acidobacteriota bacterium]